MLKIWIKNIQNGTEVLIMTENHPELGQKTTVDENGIVQDGAKRLKSCHRKKKRK